MKNVTCLCYILSSSRLSEKIGKLIHWFSHIFPSNFPLIKVLENYCSAHILVWKVCLYLWVVSIKVLSQAVNVEQEFKPFFSEKDN